MSDQEELKTTIEEQAELPDGWQIKKLLAGGVEVAKPEGGPPVMATIEVLRGEGLTEIVMGHPKMPGRTTQIRAEESGETPDVDAYREIPSTVGVLRYKDADIDFVIRVIEQIADVDVLQNVAEARDPFKGDGQEDVIDAVEKHTPVDTELVAGTLATI